jgi:hypothetical protein
MGIESHRPYLNIERNKLYAQVICSGSSWSAILNWTSLCPVHIFKRLCSKVLWYSLWWCLKRISWLSLCESQYLFFIFCVIFPSKIIFHVRCLTYSSHESHEYRKFFTWRFSYQRCWRFESFFFLHCDKLRNVRMGHLGPVCCLLLNFLENPMEGGKKFVGHNMWVLFCQHLSSETVDT